MSLQIACKTLLSFTFVCELGQLGALPSLCSHSFRAANASRFHSLLEPSKHNAKTRALVNASRATGPRVPIRPSHLVTFRCLSGSQDCRLLRKRFSSVSKWNRVIDETKNLTLNLLTLLCSWYKEKSAHAPRTDSRTHFPVGVYRQSTLAHWTFFSETWASSEPSCVASAGTDWETKIELGAEQNKSSLDWIRQQQSLYFTKNRYFRKLLFTPS